ncbi:hypothetical protein AMJ71_06085 [candidate division TA06 bacterium SM1_40]|uniref:Uncharacterized protein n=1 Tax=candidate division TA06 bacterium SM1_40 TaxID=1703773 RepID=A0A0S8JLG4_UNCT6|nr:MAG: hypothetical protein AMJ71_06085 [candidate division TA06 bacterium SM1_40]
MKLRDLVSVCVLVGMAVGQTVDSVQLFLNTDGDVRTGYGPGGYEILVDVNGDIRSTEGCTSEAGWGGLMEGYTLENELVWDCSVDPVFHVLQDADLDGDIDLEDFWVFQQMFTGPR